MGRNETAGECLSGSVGAVGGHCRGVHSGKSLAHVTFPCAALRGLLYACSHAPTLSFQRPDLGPHRTQLKIAPLCEALIGLNYAPRCWLQAPWLQHRWGSSEVGRAQANSGMRRTRQRTAVRMVAEVPALDDRVKAAMEAEAAQDAQSAQGIARFLFSRNTKRCMQCMRDDVYIAPYSKGWRREVKWVRALAVGLCSGCELAITSHLSKHARAPRIPFLRRKSRQHQIMYHRVPTNGTKKYPHTLLCTGF